MAIGELSNAETPKQEPYRYSPVRGLVRRSLLSIAFVGIAGLAGYAILKDMHIEFPENVENFLKSFGLDLNGDGRVNSQDIFQNQKDGAAPAAVPPPESSTLAAKPDTQTPTAPAPETPPAPQETPATGQKYTPDELHEMQGPGEQTDTWKTPAELARENADLKAKNAELEAKLAGATATEDTGAPEAPKRTFVSDDTYDMAQRTLSQNGWTNCVRIDCPADTQISGIEDDAKKYWGVSLSSDEATAALQHGGFVKDGVTYEVWQSPNDPSNFHIVKCDADHRLIGDVPDFDAVEKPVSEPTAVENPNPTHEHGKSGTQASEAERAEPVGFCDPRIVAVRNYYLPGFDESSFLRARTNPFNPEGGQFNEWWSFNLIRSYLLAGGRL